MNIYEVPRSELVAELSEVNPKLVDRLTDHVDIFLGESWGIVLHDPTEIAQFWFALGSWWVGSRDRPDGLDVELMLRQHCSRDRGKHDTYLFFPGYRLV